MIIYAVPRNTTCPANPNARTLWYHKKLNVICLIDETKVHVNTMAAVANIISGNSLLFDWEYVGEL